MDRADINYLTPSHFCFTPEPVVAGHQQEFIHDAAADQTYQKLWIKYKSSLKVS